MSRQANSPRRRLATPEVADGVAVVAVPLGPLGREVADLVAARTDVPRLGDQLDLADHRVLLDEVEERGQPVDVVELARERRGEVEPEPVHVHLDDPVAQRVHDQLQGVRVAHVEGVAGARCSPCSSAGRPRPAGSTPRCRCPGSSASGPGGCPRRCGCRRRRGSPRCRPSCSALTIDLNSWTCWPRWPGRRARRSRRAGRRSRSCCSPSSCVSPLSSRVLSCTNWCTGISSMAVTPSWVRWSITAGWAMPGVGAAQLLGHVGVERGQPLDVRLVDDALVVGAAERAVALPVEVGVDHDAEQHVRRGVLVVARLGVVEVVAEQRRAPVDGARGRLGVGVEQQLARVAAQPAAGVVGAVDAVAVALPGLHLGQVAVPHEGVDLGDLDAGLDRGSSGSCRRRTGTARPARRPR